MQDAAASRGPAAPRSPRRDSCAASTGAGALGGAFWGMLFGLLFFIPLLGLAVGAAMGALAGSLSDVGIDDDFIKRAGRDHPGYLGAVPDELGSCVDKVRDAFRGEHVELVSTNMSDEQERALREVFAE